MQSKQVVSLNNKIIADGAVFIAIKVRNRFLTIGCAPCTRPVRPAEDIRSGRWWWEPQEAKECGIHIVDGKIERKKPPADFQI